MCQYFNENNLCHHGRSTYKKVSSIATCLQNNTDYQYHGMGNGTLLEPVLIDLKKDFDTVDLEILCKKIEYCAMQPSEFP